MPAQPCSQVLCCLPPRPCSPGGLSWDCQERADRAPRREDTPWARRESAPSCTPLPWGCTRPSTQPQPGPLEGCLAPLPAAHTSSPTPPRLCPSRSHHRPDVVPSFVTEQTRPSCYCGNSCVSPTKCQGPQGALSGGGGSAVHCAMHTKPCVLTPSTLSVSPLLHSSEGHGTGSTRLPRLQSRRPCPALQGPWPSRSHRVRTGWAEGWSGLLTSSHASARWPGELITQRQTGLLPALRGLSGRARGPLPCSETDRFSSPQSLPYCQCPRSSSGHIPTDAPRSARHPPELAEAK